jgi:diphthine-ammonia ligase
LFIVVKALPKGAMVEKQVILHTGRCEVIDEDDGEMSIQDRQPVYKQGKPIVIRVLPDV